MARAPEASVVESAAIAAALLEEERHAGGRPPVATDGASPDGHDAAPTNEWVHEARREGLR
jgi:hypothetical protein